MADFCPHCHRSITKVETVEDVLIYAYQRRSLICPSSYAWSKPKPAAVYQNLPARVLIGIIDRGLYVYQKKGDVAYDKQGGPSTEYYDLAEVTT